MSKAKNVVKEVVAPKPRYDNVGSAVTIASPKEAIAAFKAASNAPKTRLTLADKIIVVRDPINRAREGTNRHAWIEALINSHTILEAQCKVSKLVYSVVQYAIEAGYIELVSLEGSDVKLRD